MQGLLYKRPGLGFHKGLAAECVRASGAGGQELCCAFFLRPLVYLLEPSQRNRVGSVAVHGWWCTECGAYGSAHLLLVAGVTGDAVVVVVCVLHIQ